MHIAYYQDGMYPEDNKILGIFSTEDKAKAAIAASIALDKHMYPRHPDRHMQKEYYYDIEEHELDNGE